MKNNRIMGVTLVALCAACSSLLGQETKGQGIKRPVPRFEPDLDDPRIAAAMLEDAPPTDVELDEDGTPRDWVLVEGDLIVPADAEGNVAALYETNLWPGEVPYVFDTNVAAINRTEMIAAFQALEAVSAVRFVPRFVEFNYVHIRDSNADETPRNSSQVGMQSDVQFFNMANWNGNSGVNYIIVHEGLHCLGIKHEHRAQQTVHVDAPYTARWQSSVGQRTHLSRWDGIIASFLYPEENWRFQSSSRGFALFPGDFLAPFSGFDTGYDETPAGGTLWILDPSTHAVGPVLDKPIIIAAPLGGVTLTR